MFEVFEHTADVGLRMRAPRLEELFVDAARGLTALLVENPEAVEPRMSWECHLQADQRDWLLFDWLNELLYQFDVHHRLLARCSVRLEGTQLHAFCEGETIDPARHRLDHEVKAVTYHDLQLTESPDGWMAEVILDI